MTSFPLSGEQLLDAAERESRKRSASFLRGVMRYVASPNARQQKPYPIIWKSGNCRLLLINEGNAGLPPLLMIPSLINKWNVLDLTPDTSLTAVLAEEGYPLYVVDWGIPGPDEIYFDMAGYVAVYLSDIARIVAARHNGKIIPVGYCMGGVLALGLASIAPELVQGLALLATPWDFRTPDSAYPRLPSGYAYLYEQWIDQLPLFPGEYMAMFFYLLDPWRFENKFISFSSLPDGIEARHFVAIEQWVNDCIPLTPSVAKNCLIDWMVHNKLATEQWFIMKRPVELRRMEMPTLIIAPQQDTIVPPTSARALSTMMPNATLLEPNAGHVGMVVGKNRDQHLWQPLREWLSGF